MKAGRFTTSTLLRKLGAYSKKNRLTLIVQGDSDKIVPQQQAQSMEHGPRQASRTSSMSSPAVATMARPLGLG